MNIFRSSASAISLEVSVDRLPSTRPRHRVSKALVFSDGEDIQGAATVSLKPGKSIEHSGLKTELIGSIITKSKESSFLSITKDLAPPGTLTDSETILWRFKAVDLPHESYSGTNVKLRYYIRFTIVPKGGTAVTREAEIVVHNPVSDCCELINRHNKEGLARRIEQSERTALDPAQSDGLGAIEGAAAQQPVIEQLSAETAPRVGGCQEASLERSASQQTSAGLQWAETIPSPFSIPAAPVKIDVGIENCLHIDFHLSNSVVPLDGCLVGQVHFTVVRLNIKHMELNIIRQESVGGTVMPFNQTVAKDEVTPHFTTSSNFQVDTQTVTQYELMEGTPAKDARIPVRMFLRGLPLTPTYENVRNSFSVRYFINLILVDKDSRRYFKRQQIYLYRSTVSQPKHSLAFCLAACQLAEKTAEATVV